MIIFLDSSALIFLIENKEYFSQRVQYALQRLREIAPDARFAYSQLARLETRIGPLRRGQETILASYETFFNLKDVDCIELTKKVMDLATAIRAFSGLKLADAIHAACCLQLGKDHVFLTGDKDFKRIEGLNVIRVA